MNCKHVIHANPNAAGLRCPECYAVAVAVTPDAAKRLALHVTYSLKRDAAARRAIKLLADGRDDEGNDAADEAELWALKAMALEPGNERRIS
jgi:hypothetical protein